MSVQTSSRSLTPARSATKRPARQLASLRRRLLVATVLTIPLLGGLARMTIAPWLPAVLSDPQLQLALATPVQFWAGAPFYRGALKALRHRSADMNTLIAVGTTAAYFYSLAAILFPGFFEAAGLTTEGAPPLYFDTASAIITLILLDVTSRPEHAAMPPTPSATSSAWCHGRRASSATGWSSTSPWRR
jgi:P-type Cu+ transporter